MPYRLLDKFRRTFEGNRYIHRRSNLGDLIAMELYEDLYELGRSTRLRDRVARGERVLNVGNRRVGIRARRGDGTFGELIPNRQPIRDPGCSVARGPIATVEIGVEVKILAKAMIKQIDRVINDLRGQVHQFKRGGGSPICVGIVGINQAEIYTGYEGKRAFKTDGKSRRHPVQEAPEAEGRLVEHARPHFDEFFLILRFQATNVKPYPFEWVDYERTEEEYGALLTRISREYDRRFRNGNGEKI